MIGIWIGAVMLWLLCTVMVLALLIGLSVMVEMCIESVMAWCAARQPPLPIARVVRGAAVCVPSSQVSPFTAGGDVEPAATQSARRPDPGSLRPSGYRMGGAA